MNKIERAIYDTKLHLDNLKQDRMIIMAEIQAYEKQLDTLNAINNNKSIPHIESDKPVQITT